MSFLYCLSCSFQNIVNFTLKGSLSNKCVLVWKPKIRIFPQKYRTSQLVCGRPELRYPIYLFLCSCHFVSCPYPRSHFIAFRSCTELSALQNCSWALKEEFKSSWKLIAHYSLLIRSEYLALTGRAWLPYIWAKIAEKIYRFCQKRKQLAFMYLFIYFPQVATF